MDAAGGIRGTPDRAEALARPRSHGSRLSPLPPKRQGEQGDAIHTHRTQLQRAVVLQVLTAAGDPGPSTIRWPSTQRRMYPASADTDLILVLKRGCAAAPE